MSVIERPQGLPQGLLDKNPLGSNLSFKVLIVEDDLCLKSSISRILNSISYELTSKWVTTAREGLLCLQNSDYDFVIADYLLPDSENGLWVWEKCRKTHPGMPFLLMSGIPVESFLDLTAGRKICPSFLPKPFWPAELKETVLSMIEDVLEQRKKKAA